MQMLKSTVIVRHLVKAPMRCRCDKPQVYRGTPSLVFSRSALHPTMRRSTMFAVTQCVMCARLSKCVVICFRAWCPELWDRSVLVCT